MLVLFALLAAVVALMSVGFIGGLYVNRPYRLHIPDHPVLWRAPTTTDVPRLRLIHGGQPPYNWQEDESA